MIGIIILIVFVALLGKALLETMWGGCLIIWGVICQAFGLILLALANLLDFIERLKIERRHGALSHPVHMKTTIALLATLLVSTMPGICQEPGKPAPAETATAATLPAARTITDTKGREMAGVIVSKTDTAIKFRRAADKKEFEIALDTLSDADKAFVAGLVEPPVKKPKLLYTGYHFPGATKTNDLIVEKLKNAGFEVRVELSINDKLPNGAGTYTWPGVDKMSDEELKRFDMIWEESGPHKRLLGIFPEYKGVMVMNHRGNDRLKDFLADRIGSTYGGKPYVKVDGNLVRYYDRVNIWKGQDKPREIGPIQPEFIDQAIAEAHKLLQGDYPPR